MPRWTDKSAAELAELSRRNKSHWPTDKPEVKASVAGYVKAAYAPKTRHKSQGKRGKQVPTEHEEQVLLMQLWAIYAKQAGIDERLLFSIPNGSHKGKAAAGRFKAEGLRPGVPDLFLASLFYRKNEKQYFGLFIELKRRNWKEPGSGAKAVHWRNQCNFHQMLQNQGYRVRVCAGADSAMDAIRDYLD